MTLAIPGYKLVRTLGKGGMATVYLAVQEIFEREVALKVMARGLADDPAFGQRFFREARIVSKLVHPNIVTVYDVGVHQGLYYLSMEYIDGQDLKMARKRLDLAQKLQVIQDIARALDFAGQKGYVHRDIKPENIMLFASDNRAVLMDFGIARAADADISVTQAGTAIGTPHYMSPEQAKGQAVDIRSDLYSLGVVFYLLLAGRVPYDGDSAVAIGIKHITQPIPRLPAETAAAQPVLEKLMAKKPEDRYQNPALLVAALEALKGQSLAIFDGQSPVYPEVDEPLPIQPTQFVAAATMVSPGPLQDDDDEPSFTISGAAVKVKEGHWDLTWFAVIAVLVAAGIGAGLVLYTHNNSSDERPFARLSHTETDLPKALDTPSSSVRLQPNLVDPRNPDVKARPGNIAERMALAAQYVQQGRLYSPAEDSAYAIYQAVLTAEPGHDLARKGMQALAGELSRWQKRWVAEGQYAEARNQVAMALKFRPSDKGLLLLQQQLDTAIVERNRSLLPQISDVRVSGYAINQVDDPQPESISVSKNLFVRFRLGSRPASPLQLVIYQGPRSQQLISMPVNVTGDVVSLKIEPPDNNFARGNYVLDLASAGQIVESVRFAIE